MFKMHTIYKESHGAVLLLYADLFSLRVIFRSFTHSQQFSHRLDFVKIQLCLKRDNLRHGNSPSLNFVH